MTEDWVASNTHLDYRGRCSLVMDYPIKDPSLGELDGVSKSRYGYGVNSMQSLVLAMQLLKIHIEQAIAVGWLFYFDENDDEPFDLLHSLSSHLSSSER